jgi:hypothetical protein
MPGSPHLLLVLPLLLVLIVSSSVYAETKVLTYSTCPNLKWGTTIVFCGGNAQYSAGCSKRSSNEAAGSLTTQAYAFPYVAGRQAAENEVGGFFQQPLA